MTPDRPSKTRTIPLLFILIMIFLLVAVGAVMVIMTMPIQKHFPPESPEIAAKRLSPENGFYTLERAARLMETAAQGQPNYIVDISKFGLPPSPENGKELLAYLKAAYDVREASGVPGDLSEILPDSPSELAELQEWREQVIAELLDNFDSAAPAIAEMRKGLEAEYYLLPEIGDMAMELPYLAPWRSMARVLTAQGKWYETQEMYPEAMENYLDTARLGMAAGSDGPLINGLVGIAITTIGLESLNTSINKYDDPELLRDALKTLTDVADREAPLSRIFEYEFRKADNTDLSDPGILGNPPPNSVINQISFLKGVTGGFYNLKGRIDQIRFRRNIGEYWDQFLSVVDRPVSEFEKLRPIPPSDPLSQMVIPPEMAFTAFGKKAAILDGSRISIALRLHRLEHGTYPESLDTLVPEYLDVLPLDPFTQKDFHYEKGEDDFRLYSYYYNQVDDNAMPARGLDGDMVIHLPYEELLAIEAAR